MAKRNVEKMSKTELRAACKAAGIKGYGKMTVSQMREALTKASVWDERNGPEEGTPAKRAAEPVVTTPAKVEREVRNGVKRPREGGLCAAVWAALDEMHAAGVVVTAKDARDLATAKDWNENNALCELSAWRKFMGLSKPRVMPKRKGKTAAKLAPPATLVEGAQPVV